MRFCMITTFYPPYHFGGDAIFVHTLANELATRGHHIEVIHCRDSYRLLAGREPAQGYKDHTGIRVHGLASGYGLLSPLATQQTGYPFFKGEQIRQILESGFDVIHYHNISLIGGPKILEYGAGIKLYTMHEYWLVCPMHTLFRYNRALCETPHCVTCSLSYKRPPQWWRYTSLLRSSIQAVDMFIALSQNSMELHKKMGFEAPMYHLPNFVANSADSNEISADESCQSPEGAAPLPYFLYVGRLEKLKGAHTLIPLFRDHPRAQLLIAGEGTYEADLRRLAGASKNIRFLGLVKRNELKRLYRQACALIVPSLGVEMFPLVIIEAFQSRTPVIARRIGGMPEIIHHSGGGLTYDTDEELLSAVDELLANATSRKAWGENGYVAIQTLYSSDTHLKHYFALIASLAECKQK